MKRIPLIIIYLLFTSISLVTEGCLPPPPPSNDVQCISTGRNSTHLVTTSSDGWSFGSNSYGQLGNGSTTSSNSPVQINGVTGISLISTGLFHTIILKNDSTVWTAGDNSEGQLGIGTFSSSTSLVQVTPLNNVTDISAGSGHSLFLKSDGTVWACGDNYGGQLGDGTTTPQSSPVHISTLSNIISVAGGFAHSLFLKGDGTVWSCGANFGQLGNGNTIDQNIPVQVFGLNSIVAISAGRSHSLFLRSDGTVWATGDNTYGALGNGITSVQIDSVPFQIPSINNVIAISAGRHFSLFLKNDGTVWSCGQNFYGELGNGTSGNYTGTLTQVVGLTGIVAIAAGDYHSVFLKNDQTVWICGYNNDGQLGNGTNVDQPVPIEVPGF